MAKLHAQKQKHYSTKHTKQKDGTGIQHTHFIFYYLMFLFVKVIFPRNINLPP